MKWEYLREEEFAGAIEKSGGLCVMSIGCIEKHGQHLPLGTDSLKADKIVELAAERAGVVMFPTTMWLGDVMSSHALKNPAAVRRSGYIGMNPHTLLTVLEELCDEIARNGFTKILLCNSHGGNAGLLNFFLRLQGYKKKKYATMACRANDLTVAKMRAAIKADPESFSMLTEEDHRVLERFSDPSCEFGHGCFVETMLTLGTYPELVAEDRYEAESGLSTHRADYLSRLGVDFAYSWLANYPNAYTGTAPVGCSRTLAEAAMKLTLDRLTRIFEILRDDTECLAMIDEVVPSL